MIRVYIFQHNKVIDYFDTEEKEINDEIREKCDMLVGWAVNEKRAEKGYYLVQIVDLNGLNVLDEENMIA